MTKAQIIFEKIGGEIYFGHVVDRKGKPVSSLMSSRREDIPGMLKNIRSRGWSVKDKKIYRYEDKKRTSAELADNIIKLRNRKKK